MCKDYPIRNSRPRKPTLSSVEMLSSVGSLHVFPSNAASIAYEIRSAGFTRQHDHLLYAHTGRLQSAWHG